MSFKHYLPSLCSPVVAVADPSENVVDEAWMPVVFSWLLLGYSCDWLTRENSLHQGAYPGVANLNHAPYLRVFLKAVIALTHTCTHETTRGIVRLRIPSKNCSNCILSGLWCEYMATNITETFFFWQVMLPVSSLTYM